jgi:hypothetical protein
MGHLFLDDPDEYQEIKSKRGLYEGGYMKEGIWIEIIYQIKKKLWR